MYNKEACSKYYATHRPEILQRKKDSRWRISAREVAQKKEYMKAHPLKRVHNDMMRRCGIWKGATTAMMKSYAMRGITVCEEWRECENFEKWALANGYKTGLQLDRVNTDGNYEPSNCRFITPKENRRNMTTNVMVMFNGELMCLAEAVEKSKTRHSYDEVLTRYHRWGDLDRALYYPALKTRKYLYHKGDDWRKVIYAEFWNYVTEEDKKVILETWNEKEDGVTERSWKMKTPTGSREWKAAGKSAVLYVDGIPSGYSEPCATHEAAVRVAERLNEEDEDE